MPDKDGIEKFSPHVDPGRVGQNWIVWRDNFEMFLLTKSDATSREKLGYLMLKAGSDVQRIYQMRKALAAQDQDEEERELQNPFDEAIEILDREFIHQKNDAFQRGLFRQMSQDANEPIVSYVARLRQQAQFCGHQDEEEMEKAITR